MAKNFALVSDGIVLNVWANRLDTETAADVSPLNASAMVECPSNCEAGWTYNGSTFTPRAVPVEDWRDLRRKALREFRDRNDEDETTYILRMFEILFLQVEQMRQAAGIAMTPRYSALRSKLAEIRSRYPES